MTASNNDTSAQRPDDAASETAASESAGAPVAPPAAVPAAASSDSERRRTLSRWLAAGLVLAVVVIAALSAALRHQQQQFDAFAREATRRLTEISSHADEARNQARQALMQSQSVGTRLSTLDERTRRTEDQQKVLDQAYRELVSGDDEATLVGVEQSLLLAAEQLQLAGRVPSAIAALQLAEARLARSGRPAFLPAQQAIARDMNRLLALPLADFSRIVQQVDDVIAAIETFPLAAPLSMQQAAPPSAGDASALPESPGALPEVDPDADWWERVWVPVRNWSERARVATLNELRELIRVQRVDAPDALLLSTEQGELLRENLELRMLEARMALLGREASLWRSNLAQVTRAVRYYGDPNAPETGRLVRQLEQLREIDPSPEMPDLAESLATVRALLAGAGGANGDASGQAGANAGG